MHDETTELPPLPHRDPSDTAVPGPAVPSAVPPTEAEQVTLPFDDDEPIPFRLTARARRTVAPGSLPELAVVRGHVRRSGAPTDLDDPADTRAARARALRRAGVGLDAIADELEVDVLAVRAWVDEVAPVASATRRRLRPVPGVQCDEDEQFARARAEAAERAAAWRDEAHAEAAARLGEDHRFAAGLGLVASLVEVTPHAATLVTRDRAVAARVARWLRAELELADERLRVLLRLAPVVAGDVEAHAIADQLGVPVERVSTTRWRTAPDPDAVEVSLRIADPRAAARLAGWRDALLDDV